MSDFSTRIETRPDFEEAEALLCRACGYTVTDEASRVSRGGGFFHTFANPAGYIYKIGCFSSAPGARIVGDYSHDFTWFKGYAWCYLICCSCFAHLGWHFSGPATEDFHGIILERLAENR